MSCRKLQTPLEMQFEALSSFSILVASVSNIFFKKKCILNIVLRSPNLYLFQTYAADIFFGQSWDDHRLKLPANMTSEYRLLPVEWLGRRHSVQLTVQIMNL